MFAFQTKLKVVLQGFGNLVGLKPSPIEDTYKVQNKPFWIGSKPQRKKPDKQSCPNTIPTRFWKPCRIRDKPIKS